MSEKVLYLVSYRWYEDYSPTLLLGPAVENWKEFCDSLLGRAASQAVKRQVEGNNSWVGWQDVVDELIAILKDRGYQKIDPPEAGYWGSCIIRDQEDDKGKLSDTAFSEIAAHNDRVEKMCNEYLPESEATDG